MAEADIVHSWTVTLQAKVVALLEAVQDEQALKLCDSSIAKYSSHGPGFHFLSTLLYVTM